MYFTYERPDFDISDPKEIRRVIEEAYRPIPTRTFLRAEVKDPETGGWKQIPLGMTES